MNLVATAFPKTHFACIDYAPRPDGSVPENVSGLVFREEEGSFLVGAVAGLLSKSGHVGFVGGMDIPLIHRFEGGYRAGVLEVCPKCTVHIAYAGSTPEAFHDPAKGKALAIGQITAGADVLFHARSGPPGTASSRPLRDSGAKAIGVDSDQFDEMPGTVATSMIKRGDVAGVRRHPRHHGGPGSRAGLRSFGLAEKGIGYVSEGPHGAAITPEIKARVADLAERIVRGEIKVPTR